MTDTNMIYFIGRIVKDAVLEEKNNVTFSKFTVAVNRDVRVGEEKKTETSFINLTIFDKYAKKMTEYLTKGTQVSITGHIKENKWSDENGNHSILVVVAEKIQLLGGSKKKEDNEAGAETKPLVFEEVSYENNTTDQKDYNMFF